MEAKSDSKENTINNNTSQTTKEENFVYFNTSYEESKEYQISLSQEYKGFETLEKIYEKSEKKSNYSIIIKVYRFKIIPEYLQKVDNNEYQIPVIMEEKENKTQHQYIIKIKNIKKDFYEYNFNIEEIDVLPMKYEKQFEIYTEILRKYKIKQSDKESIDFIILSQTLLTGGNKQFNFAFYLLIFLECFNTNKKAFNDI